MVRKRRRFAAAFKAEAIREVQRGGRPASVIARELGLHAEVLRSWVRQARDATPGPARPENLEEENRRLRREFTRALEERDISKKGSSRNSGERRADLEEEVRLVAIAVRHALEEFDGPLDCTLCGKYDFTYACKDSTYFRDRGSAEFRRPRESCILPS